MMSFIHIPDPTLAETVLNDPSFNCELLEPLQKHKISTRSYLFEYAEKLKAYKVSSVDSMICLMLCMLYFVYEYPIIIAGDSWRES